MRVGPHVIGLRRRGAAEELLLARPHDDLLVDAWVAAALPLASDPEGALGPYLGPYLSPYLGPYLGPY